MSSRTSAVVLFSGGQDSTTCLYWAKERFETVYTLGFDYGQTHIVELKQANIIADRAQCTFDVLNLTALLGDSALTDSDRPMDERHPRNPNVPSTFVPARNALFLTVAAAFAHARNCFDLVTGTCETDYSGYPDCRRVFIDSCQTTLSLAMEPHDFRIHTPLMYLDKADTFKLADDLGILEIVLEDTHTDYHGSREVRNDWGYGNLDNDASRLRANGWLDYLKRYGKT